jgi:valyl-tRNA synthetase
VLVHVFDAALRLLHPVVPFITEALWQRLPLAGRAEDAVLATQTWPAPGARYSDASRDFALVQEAVIAIRQLRSDYALPPGKSVDVLVIARDGASSAATAEVLREEEAVLSRLARATIATSADAPREAAAHVLLTGGTELVVPLAGLIDLDRECARLRQEREQLRAQLEALRGRLANERFIAKAPPQVVDAERAKEREWSERHAALGAKVESLCGAR